MYKVTPKVEPQRDKEVCLCCRFCDYERPNVTLKSESNEMMIIFKSNYSFDYSWLWRGFQAVVKAGTCML